MPNCTARFGPNLHPIAVEGMMDLVRKLRRKHKKPKDTTDSSLTPTAAAPGSTRGSKRDRWLARAALILDLTKSAADAGGLAPLKGACDGMVTLLGSIQVTFA